MINYLNLGCIRDCFRGRADFPTRLPKPLSDINCRADVVIVCNKKKQESQGDTEKGKERDLYTVGEKEIEDEHEGA